MTPTWHSLDPVETGKRLEVDPKQGLTAETVAKRHAEDGPNVLRDAKPMNPWALLVSQFKSPLIALLFGAAVVAGLVGEWIDAGAIAAIVVLNALVGFFQEYRAEQAMAALKTMTAPTARILRDGRSIVVPAAEVVRGDVLLLEAGDQVAADARLLVSADLRVLESALTGESEPSEKHADRTLPDEAPLADRVNLVFMGTSVAAGTATALVIATGMRTEIGSIATMLETEEREATPLQKQLAVFGKAVFYVCLGLVALVFVLGLLRGMPVLELFLLSISLAVAAVPEGLPAIVTIALALGVKRMAKRKALIRRLHSVETLGSAEVICTDKTGTLTTGEMTVRELYVAGDVFQPTGEGLDPTPQPDGGVTHEGVAPTASQLSSLRTLALIHTGCNNAGLALEDSEKSGNPETSEASETSENSTESDDSGASGHSAESEDSGETGASGASGDSAIPAVSEKSRWVVTGDPTEGALLAAGRKIGVPQGFPENHPVLGEYPFDSDGKRHGVFRTMPAEVEGGALGPLRLLVNGAPDVLIGLCTHELTAEGVKPLTDEGRARILEVNADMAARALRVLGSAYRDFSENGNKSENQGGGSSGDFNIPGRSEAERDLIFAGLAGLQDPPRPEAAAAIARCDEAGIRVVMITGDHPSTAQAVANELGLKAGPEAVISGVELDALDDAALTARVGSVVVYARVTAAHKLRIVKALRGSGTVGPDTVVAMTGDGVNDAPALKGSDIGIAMGRTGTEVTKQTADVILADDNFATIVAAVEEGRGVYFNIRKTLQYLLAGNAGELMVILFAIAWGWPSPLLPVHLLWINLITDGLPALVLAADRADASLMRRKPRKPGESLANRPFLLGLLGTGLLTAVTSLTVFGLGLLTGDLASARSDAFDTLVLSEVFRALAYHSDRLPFWRCRFRSLAPLWATIVGIVGLQALCHEVPVLARILHLQPWDAASLALIIPMSLLPLLVLELRKVFGPTKDA